MKVEIKTLLFDADALIDYVNSNKNIILVATKTLYDIYVPLTVMKEEIRQLSEDEANSLGIRIFEPTFNQINKANKEIKGLSFEDKICFIIAKENNWTCITNDKNLRNKCYKEGIEIMWGLQLMLELYAEKYICKEEAIDTVWKIHKSNSRITKDIVEDFIRKLH